MEVKRKTLKEGIEQGILETKKEIVLNMYNKNYKIEDILKITNLSIQQIKEIIENHK